MSDQQAVIARTKQTLQALGFDTADEYALDIHYRLVQSIEQLIAQQGCVSFQDFMQQALYASGLGYYTAGSRKLGEQGDFITAPEMGSLFARCLAVAVCEVFAVMSDANNSILELGPGSGRLCFDVLTELDKQGSLPERYYLLEVSPDLKQRQQQLIQSLPEPVAQRVVWLDSWPQDFRGVVLANEVLDAFAVRKFRMKDSGIVEVGVTLAGAEFAWCELPASVELTEAVNTISKEIDHELSEGYESEWCEYIVPWMQGLSDSMTAGAVLLIDYGYARSEYYLPERTQGTLMCHYQHRAHGDPLVLVGMQDITTHVDFSFVAQAATQSGFSVQGYTNQANFLLGCGLDQLLQSYADDDMQTYMTQVQNAKKLIMPGEMGERFKVLGLTKNIDVEMSGFKVRDFAHRLMPGN
jgi:SAM-dependent MidA family methyltransferase